MRERVGDVEHGMLECQSLALVHGDGPCQPEGVLLEGAFYFFFYFFALFVNGIFGVFPCLDCHVYVVVILMAAHYYDVCALVIVPDDVFYCANLTIVILLRFAWVVFDEHDLRPWFKN